jgi:hypothetical protein
MGCERRSSELEERVASLIKPAPDHLPDWPVRDPNPTEIHAEPDEPWRLTLQAPDDANHAH